jgi:hypothetical protein
MKPEKVLRRIVRSGIGSSRLPFLEMWKWVGSWKKLRRLQLAPAGHYVPRE